MELMEHDGTQHLQLGVLALGVKMIELMCVTSRCQFELMSSDTEDKAAAATTGALAVDLMAARASPSREV